MASAKSMATGVAVWRTIAAKSHAAFLTGPKVNPVAANFHALFAFEALRLFDRINRFDVRTSIARHVSLLIAAI